jgi:hypothetical protein
MLRTSFAEMSGMADTESIRSGGDDGPGRGTEGGTGDLDSDSALSREDIDKLNVRSK